MRLPLELLATARHLLEESPDRPVSQANLRRSVSTVYYALFHTVAEDAAELIAGPKANKRIQAHTYRAVDHGTIKRGCLNHTLLSSMPKAVRAFADLLIQMQTQRHIADYDSEAWFFPETVGRDIEAAAEIIKAYSALSDEDRRTFLALMMLRTKA